MDQVALGKRIKAARERAGMTQEDLAAAVDYSVDHVSVVERGVKAPKLDKLVTIANVLKVGTDELLQDNLDAATLLHATELSERLKALSPEGQRKVMNVLDTLRRHNTTVDEVRKEIRIAMAVAMCSPDPNVQKRWREIPHDGEVLTLEDFIAYAERKCLERL